MRAICSGPVQWRGCYSGQYDLWSPESFSHPAKMAPGLAFRILSHLEELGLLQPGSTILDPMAGTGTSLLAAAIRGYRAVGIELEDRFCKLARANAERIGLKGFGAPIEVIQGDARHLSELLAEKGMVSVTSPPWNQQSGGHGEASRKGTPDKGMIDRQAGGIRGGMGNSPGNIGSLPDAPITVTSPPYEEAFSDWRNKGSKMGDLAYGTGGRNIGNLPAGIGDAPQAKSESWRRKAAIQVQESYLDAMRQVYAEIAKVSPILVVVVKDPTRAGKLRLLGEDTARLMEAAGYRIFCRHRAILFEEQEQGHLFKGSVKQPKGRLGFFKRLAYRKGLEIARYEHVLIGIKEGSGPAAITSPPYGNPRSPDAETEESYETARNLLNPCGRKTYRGRYGNTPGQIGHLKDGG